MRYLKITLAGVTIGIEIPYRIAGNLYQDFSSDSPVDYSMIISKEDIAIKKSEDNSPNAEIIGWAGYLNENIILRRIAEKLLEYDIMLVHGASISIDGKSFLFIASSGTGKTTHIMKWLEKCPDAVVINGDKPFIKINDDGIVFTCGSPWAGKENLYTNIMVPLKSIILIERAEDNYIERISFADAFPSLLQQVYQAEDEGKMRKTLRLMQRLNPVVSFWRFQCNNFKDDCFNVAYTALMGKEAP